MVVVDMIGVYSFKVIHFRCVVWLNLLCFLLSKAQ
jgi:hypothetical protein